MQVFIRWRARYAVRVEFVSARRAVCSAICFEARRVYDHETDIMRQARQRNEMMLKTRGEIWPADGA